MDGNITRETSAHPESCRICHFCVVGGLRDTQMNLGMGSWGPQQQVGAGRGGSSPAGGESVMGLWVPAGQGTHTHTHRGRRGRGGGCSNATPCAQGMLQPGWRKPGWKFRYALLLGSGSVFAGHVLEKVCVLGRLSGSWSTPGSPGSKESPACVFSFSLLEPCPASCVFPWGVAHPLHPFVPPVPRHLVSLVSAPLLSCQAASGAALAPCTDRSPAGGGSWGQGWV